jgi:hypothetical protein
MNKVSTEVCMPTLGRQRAIVTSKLDGFSVEVSFVKVIAKICVPIMEAATLVRFLMKIRRPPPEEAAALNKVFAKN